MKVIKLLREPKNASSSPIVKITPELVQTIIENTSYANKIIYRQNSLPTYSSSLQMLSPSQVGYYIYYWIEDNQLKWFCDIPAYGMPNAYIKEGT